MSKCSLPCNTSRCQGLNNIIYKCSRGLAIFSIHHTATYSSRTHNTHNIEYIYIIVFANSGMHISYIVEKHRCNGIDGGGGSTGGGGGGVYAILQYFERQLSCEPRGKLFP